MVCKKLFLLFISGWSLAAQGYTAGQTVSGYSLALQSDQKSILTGNAIKNGSSSIIIARYNTNGSLDATYGQDGVALITVDSSTNQYSYAIALQSDGKAIIACNAIINGLSKAVLLRLTMEGILDSTFGTNGIVVLSLEKQTSALAISIQSDDKIVIGGSYVDDLVEILVARFNTDGSLDNSFGSNGYTRTSLQGNAVVSSMILQSTEKIVVSGTVQGNHFMARYARNGLLDTTFGLSGYGIVTTSLGNVGIIYALGVNAADELYAGGYQIRKGLLLKYSAEGILDVSFGSNGTFLFSSGALTLLFGIYCLDGALLFSGSSSGIAMVGKIFDTGVFDTSFGNGGIMRLTQGIDDSIAYSMQEQTDGKFLAGGLLCRGCLVFRFDGVGSLDTTFDGSGFTNDPSGDPCKVTAGFF
jgi:uncharacterized delta-60 repeat protein